MLHFFLSNNFHILFVMTGKWLLTYVTNYAALCAAIIHFWSLYFQPYLSYFHSWNDVLLPHVSVVLRWQSELSGHRI